MRTNFTRILGTVMVIAILALTFGSASAQDGYLLAGTVHPSNRVQSDNDHRYDARWETSGRIWQPNLPPANQREWFAVAFELVPGSYTANAVACRMYIDEDRSGGGSSERQVLDHENGVQFDVRTPNGLTSFALIECDGGVSTGFEVIWNGSEGFNVNRAAILGIPDVQPTNNAPAMPTNPATPMPTNPAPMVPTNPAPAPDIISTYAGCQEDIRDGWVLVSPDQFDRSKTCRENSRFDASDCSPTNNGAAINTASSGELKVCTYFQRETGPTEGTDILSQIGSAIGPVLGAILGFIWSNLFLLLLLALILWLLFFRKPAQAGQGRFANWGIVKWLNRRNAQPAAEHDTAHAGDITINDDESLVVEVDANDDGFSFEPSFDVKDGKEVRATWATLPKGTKSDNKETGEVVLGDANAVKRGAFTATLTIITIGEEHPTKVSRTYKFHCTPKTRGTTDVPPTDTPNPPAPPTPADPHAGLVPVLVGGQTEWVTPAVAQFLATLSNPAPAADDPNRPARRDSAPATTTEDSIETWYLPKGFVGAKYGKEGRGFYIHVNRRGGHRDYNWTISGLPAGMTATGEGQIGETPTEAGTFNVRVVATHKRTSAQLEKTLELVIDPATTQSS